MQSRQMAGAGDSALVLAKVVAYACLASLRAKATRVLLIETKTGADLVGAECGPISVADVLKLCVPSCLRKIGIRFMNRSSEIAPRSTRGGVNLWHFSGILHGKDHSVNLLYRRSALSSNKAHAIVRLSLGFPQLMQNNLEAEKHATAGVGNVALVPIEAAVRTEPGSLFIRDES